MAITIEALDAAGYKRYNMGVSGYALMLCQKRVYDEKGIKYHISVDVFGAHPGQPDGTFNFDPQVQFTDDDDRTPTVNMMYLDDSETTVQDIEDFFERAWHFMGRPYYERNVE
jgi:hypothetical protein